ncbi:MAG TPA: hydrogenase maturation nickel metallochaperone HypA [Myxococcota bacterium]|jgi:hydrogenase nickel incorporation protein HypA/HybF|nr:hydrogenase maturation nickel metallochaperone HypA [Myxococcota bacterium]
MHEAKLCLALLDLAERRLEAAGADRILALDLAVGEWAGVAPEALAAVFPLCAAGTRAAGAELRIARVSGRDLVLRELEVT